MAYFEDLYQRLFPTKKQNGKIIHEVISRSDKYQQAFQEWMVSDRKDDQLDKFMKGYHYKKMKIRSDYDVHLLDSSYANGFALSYPKEMQKDDFQFIFDYFSVQMQALEYKVANSDVMISEKNDYVETKEKHYLKPKISETKPPMNQQFGNVLIEHILIDDKPSYLKLVATVYSDSLYQQPRPFEDLLEYLFKV